MSEKDERRKVLSSRMVAINKEQIAIHDRMDAIEDADDDGSVHPEVRLQQLNELQAVYDKLDKEKDDIIAELKTLKKVPVNVCELKGKYILKF